MGYSIAMRWGADWLERKQVSLPVETAPCPGGRTPGPEGKTEWFGGHHSLSSPCLCGVHPHYTTNSSQNTSRQVEVPLDT